MMPERVASALSILLFLTACIGTVPGQSVPYRTSFEEPDYTLGNAAGQDGWKDVSATGAGAIQSANASGVKRGSQSLMIQPGAAVGKDLNGAAATTVYVDGYYLGPTVSETIEVTAITEPGTSLLLFHATLGILALNGNGTGGGAWEQTGVPVSTNGLQRITICQHYKSANPALQSWDLYIDGGLRKQGLGFKNNSITEFTGIDIETSETGQAFLDDLAVTTTPPDFLATPALLWFQAEWMENGGSFNWDLYPLAPDERVDSRDLGELLNRLGE